MKRSLVLAAAAAATLFAATAAQAGGIHWSVGVSLPPVATVVSNGPAYYPAPYYGAPVYNAPTYHPEPVYYAPPAYSYYPAPVVYAPRFHAPRPRVWVAPVRAYHRGPWHGHRHDRFHHGRRADARR